MRALRTSLDPRALTTACLAIAACGGLCACGADEDAGERWTWDLPAGFPTPRVPDDNPMSEEKVELGRRLFYDTRLSLNQTQSCASCHRQELAFTDGEALAEGSTGEVHLRGSMALGNIAYQPTLTWANPLLTDLEGQALLPLFGEDPIVELGFVGRESELLARLSNDSTYVESFSTAFPTDSEPISVGNITKAIASFERTLISGRSPYDRYVQDSETNALSDSAVRGLALFNSEKVECFHCHGSFNFSAQVDHAMQVFTEAAFFNTGLYNVDGRGAYPAGNRGLFEITFERNDMGHFKPPSLRNIAVTAPYMHDGSIATLEEVIDFYAAGGRNVTDGPNVGDGRDNPLKNVFVRGFTLTDQERADLLAFLESLTDDEFLNDPRFSDPFE